MVMVDFADFPLDIIYEILGHLSVEDIVQAREVCQRLRQATYQRSVWVNVYERSDFLLQKGPLSSQSSMELECSLIRAAKINRNWTSGKPTIYTRRRFPRTLPTYDFDSNVISGRFLQLAESTGISWYDLEADDIATPVLTYPCLSVVPMAGYLNHQVNAIGEGPHVVWVSFVSSTPRTICVLKVDFINYTANLHAKIPAINCVGIRMNYDWLLPIREFSSPDDPIDLFHLPSCSTLYLPMHENVRNLSDLNCMNYVITSRYLYLMFSLRSETLIDMYRLPTSPGAATSQSNLPKSHSGRYPHAISNLHLVEAHHDPPHSTSSAGQQSRTTFLALVYVSRSPTTWTSKIGLHVFDAIVDSTETLTLTTRAQTTLNVGIATTALSLSASSGVCLAVTHSSPGPVILAHHIRRQQDSVWTMSVKALKLSEDFQSRDMIAFDGFRGRLCLINGWTNIEILDYA